MTIQLSEITKDCIQLEIESLRDLGRLIFNEDIICYLRRENDRFELISQAELRERWDKELKRHLTLEDRAYLDDFANGYCYFPEIWVNQCGMKILILLLAH